MSFPRYPEYKDSGVDWLGRVPAHWRVLRMAMLEKTGRDFVSGPFGSSLGSDDYVENGIPVIRGLNTTLKAEARFVPEGFVFVDEAKFSELNRCDARPGDLVFTARGTVGKVGVVPATVPKALISPNQLRYRPDLDLVAVDYLYYLFASVGLMSEITLVADSVAQPNLNLGNLKSLRISIPPKIEQCQITAFLDRETAKIDALVAEQRRLMALLKEKRQAVISHAVTRGLNPDAPMKPSGIEWLGEVPAHWEVMSLRRAIEFLTDYEANGSFADTKLNVQIDEGDPYAWYVRATDLEQQRHGLVEGNRYCDEGSYEWLQKTSLFGGELLVAKRGEIGKVYVMPKGECRATLAPNLYLIRLNANLTPTFAWYWFSVDPGRAELVLADKSTTIGALYKDDARSMMIVAPPISEQKALVLFLNEKVSEFDTLTTEAQRAIDLLQERRTALISAAVTGQIDVRSAVMA